MSYAGGMSSADIIRLALQDTRRGPNFAPQASLLFNTILRDLCLNYDLEVNKRFATVTLTGAPNGPSPNWVTANQTSGEVTVPQGTAGGFASGIGPYALPADYLRTAQGGMTYSFNGVPYEPVECKIEQMFFLALNPASPSNPAQWATRFFTGTDPSNWSVPELYVYPPPDQQYTVNLLYYCIQSDIADPSATATYPWFPGHQYLRKELAAQLMCDRAMHEQALEHLEKYLQNEPDTEKMAITISLDPNQFRPRSSQFRLPPLKGRDL